jgi:tartrate-resistant acid phosphatase type 5
MNCQRTADLPRFHVMHAWGQGNCAGKIHFHNLSAAHAPAAHLRRQRFLRVVLAGCLLVTALIGRGEQWTIGVLGDYGVAYAGGAFYSNELAVANLIKSWNPDFIITTGDNNYPDGEASNIDTNIGQFFHEFIHPYVGTFGAGASSNRFWPCIGNHEWPTGVAALQPYLDYFTLPGNERYYSHRHGPVELFAVVGDQQEPDGATPTSVQAMWLSNALAASSAPWRIVYFHASPYSSSITHGSYTHQADNMLWPFTDWGASVIYTGHNHLYERVLTNSLNYVTIGLGGGRVDGFTTPVPGSLSRYNATYGAVRLVVTETNLVSDFINISNQVIDTFTLEAMPARLSLHWKSGAPELRLAGSPGRSYITQASTNLTNWTSIWTNHLTTPMTNVVNTAHGGRDSLFYRTVNGR